MLETKIRGRFSEGCNCLQAELINDEASVSLIYFLKGTLGYEVSVGHTLECQIDGFPIKWVQVGKNTHFAIGPRRAPPLPPSSYASRHGFPCPNKPSNFMNFIMFIPARIRV